MFRILGLVLAAATILLAVVVWRRGRRLWLKLPGAMLLLLLALAVGFTVPTVWGKPWSIGHLYQRIFLRFLLDHPALLTQLRFLEPLGITGHNRRLEDYAVGFSRYELERDRRWAALLRSYDREGLEDKLSFDILVEYIGDPAERARFAFHDFPCNPVAGAHQGLAELLLKYHRIDDPRGAEHYVARLEAVGPALSQLVAQLRFREGRKLIPPRTATAKSAAQARQVTAAPADRSELYTRLVQRLSGLEGMSDEERRALRERALAAIKGSVYPGFRALAAYLDELSRRSAGDDGVWRLPDGDAYYAWLLRRHTTTDLTPAQVHELGLTEVARLEGEIRASLARQAIDVPGELGDALRRLTRLPRFKYPHSEQGRARVLADFGAIIRQAREATRPAFGKLPRAEVVVKAAPEHREKGAFAYYVPPAMDGSLPGTFYFDMGKLDDLYSFGMKTLACHEAVPGHHHQLALGLEMQGRPTFRKVIGFVAFVEGWALYAEQLADEAGFFQDPFDELGYQMMQLLRAARMVVDTGLHARRWSRDEAIAYMRAHTGEPLAFLTDEVDRYLTMPGQATTYMVGKLFLLQLRARARAALGGRFDPRAFHDELLEGGQMPLRLLQQKVERWIATEQRRGRT